MRKWLAVLIPVVVLLAFPLFITVYRVMEERSQEPALPADIATWQKRETCDVSGSKILVYIMYDKVVDAEPRGIRLAKVDGRLVFSNTGSTKKLHPEQIWIRQPSGEITISAIPDKETYDREMLWARKAIEAHGVNLSDLVPCN